jgi:single-strand DNA-binding protein
MSSFNKIILVGNLGRDPELRYSPQGTAIASFSMATNERRKGKEGEAEDVTTWFRVTTFGKQAENVSKYLAKGRKVYVEGRLRDEEWTDKDKNPRHTLEVTASDVQFLDSGQAVAAGAGAGGGTTPAPQGGGKDPDDEIPF